MCKILYVKTSKVFGIKSVTGYYMFIKGLPSVDMAIGLTMGLV